MDQIVKDRITALLQQNDTLLFMKGTRDFPQCGFSAKAVDILEAIGLEDYKDVNILEDSDLRDGLKEYSQWPTFPQFYVKGQLFGGADILQQAYEEETLTDDLRKAGLPL